MKILLLEPGSYPEDELAGFEVVAAPQDDVVAVLTMASTKVGEELMARLPALRAIGTASVGFDHVDVEAAERRGVVVVNVPDYCTEEVADHTLALLYGLVRRVVELDRMVQRGGWNATGAGPLGTVAGMRVGIVGLGRIGTAVATRLLALGAEVWATDILPVPHAGVRFVELDELLEGCDAVTVHVPLTTETRDLIGAREIASMRPGAFLVNTSRGKVVDFDAVLEALRDGRLGGAGLDVIPHEPPPAPPVAPNLILTPHAAYYSPRSERRAFRDCVARVREVLGA
ncbi:MAG: D-3-phosphoglycerate dehydrogenase / 2-oxoglutarate reductase [Gaiellaceae bacterium]|jgi:D-3-phosphoglycerate dehydrogenase|nr:D-3-phosphoglycerate dehydrogenase / 2-oxoglutarate reductase [Gaiellaceae bacterium]MDX6468799.1 D-3-phosphoglycerate dehydrogenase / 2-oxoglutarate reductase [Gaiellaceae bacterium]